MATLDSLHAQMAAVMEVLNKTALDEISKLVDDASGEFRQEISRSQRENEALKSDLRVMGELRSALARGCVEGTSDSSPNIAVEAKVCDEFREEQNSKFIGKGCVVAAERVFDEKCVPVVKEEPVPDALEMKCEPGSTEGQEAQCAPKTTRSGKVREMVRHRRGTLKQAGVRSSVRISPRNSRASQRLLSEER